ncbi:MAG TPA: sialidase family protein [Terriglobales bacterium]|nr:sialidase family protein [Terriglobales bacterium]
MFVALVALFSSVFFAPAQAATPVRQISIDIFSNTSSQHKTEVEPDTFAFGSTIVTAFQVGRIFNGGSSDIGFATSTNGGTTWTHGYLPGITTFYKGGTFTAASDPSVAYDAKHGLWMVSSLGLAAQNVVLVSTSHDGLTWNNPITANRTAGFADKEWIVCDNTASSPFFGNCYIEFDDADLGDQEEMLTSSDGGSTWSKAFIVRNAFGLGGQPLVQPSGTVVVPFEGNGMQAFSSTDGGSTWGNVVTISQINDHFVGGNLRTSPLPSAELDANGTIYVAWQDCRFRSGCASNDIVFSTSADGKTWSSVSRIPIDPTSSKVDHFIPGLAVDPNTAGSTAHLALTYFFYPTSNCSTSTCKLGVGFVSSQDGGKTWSAVNPLVIGMNTSWLANTNQGRMVGDYISTSFVNGKAFGVFAKAFTPGTLFSEAMYTPSTGLEDWALEPLPSSANDQPVPNAHSDHGPRQFYDLDGQRPIPSDRRGEFGPPGDRD